MTRKKRQRKKQRRAAPRHHPVAVVERAGKDLRDLGALARVTKTLGQDYGRPDLPSGINDQLAALELVADELEWLEHEGATLHEFRVVLIESLRDQGITWDRLAGVAGVSRQALIQTLTIHRP